jgi:uncharacterized protein YciW
MICRLDQYSRRHGPEAYLFEFATERSLTGNSNSTVRPEVLCSRETSGVRHSLVRASNGRLILDLEPDCLQEDNRALLLSSNCSAGTASDLGLHYTFQRADQPRYLSHRSRAVPPPRTPADSPIVFSTPRPLP